MKFLEFIVIYIIVSVIVSTIRYLLRKNSTEPKYYEFNVTDCNSNKIEFAVKANNIQEAMETVRNLIKVIDSDKWIEFPLSEEECENYIEGM